MVVIMIEIIHFSHIYVENMNLLYLALNKDMCLI